MLSESINATTNKPQTMWFRKPWVIALIVLAVVFGWLAKMAFIDREKNFASDAWHCWTTDCNPTGPAVPWQEQLAAADVAARKIDPGALLTGIDVRSAYFGIKAYLPNDTLSVTFHYITLMDSDLQVSVWDSDPSHVEISQRDNPNQAYYDADLERKDDIEAIKARIQISPRQAVELTRAKAMELSQDANSKPLLSIFLFGEPEEARKWHAQYDPIRTQNRDKVDIFVWPTFNVDATSGAVEDISLTNASPTPTH